ncbi:GH3 auxin-responsive promoter family protein [Aureispira anguillae]|uniref:GH3 auxin-responsive promoter family protein n=1 Tax=Aureispira anguillae TaxID=2864201 RepID=A0A916DVS9_9BACT|nr:GH3 auxin-responsive promoter family protein [Aureispira anguillae]BDS15459.1 GH3 auxin-responsive promoter family protein [Aureispira anguillae]
MKWLNAVIKTGFNLNMHRVQRAIEKPIDTQERVFKQLIQQASTTAFGKKYGFGSINSIQQLQERVPIHSYEMLAPYIQRMMKGEKNVLYPGKVTYFSRSSGTTNNKSKYIPVPPNNLKHCHLKGAHDAVSIWFHNYPKSKLFDASRAIIMGGELSIFDRQAQTFMGDVSAIMLQHLPFYAAYFLTPNIPTALLPDWEKKIEKIAQVAVHQNISNLSGVPTWTLVLLRRILELSGKKNLSEVFPNFELYAHGGVDFSPYRSQFDNLFPCKTVEYRNTYNASEGFFATQFSKEDQGMQLLFDSGVFYEFIPLDQLHKDQPQAYTIEQVQKGIDYAIVISTNAGLWRYMIGDTVRFSSLYPHHIEITGRTQQFINVFGEEVMVWNAEKALTNTCYELDAQISEYTVAPIFLSKTSKGGHEWLVEFQKSPQSMLQFQQLLDMNLQKLNSDYEAKRYKDIALQELELTVVPPGSFHNWLKSKGKYGGQHKIPRLSNKRQYLEEILASFPIKS